MVVSHITEDIDVRIVSPVSLSKIPQDAPRCHIHDPLESATDSSISIESHFESPSRSACRKSIDSYSGVSTPAPKRASILEYRRRKNSIFDGITSLDSSGRCATALNVNNKRRRFDIEISIPKLPNESP